MSPRNRRSREIDRRIAVVVGLIALCVALIAVDSGARSPFGAARAAVGAVVGPLQQAGEAVVRPLVAVTRAVRTQRSLRTEVAELKAENAQLVGQAAAVDLDRRRLDELDGLIRSAHDTGYSLVAARVIALGPASSFEQTVTIDAGSTAGVRNDMTVLNNNGLVGRVVRTTRTTATVLLISDRRSVVGGRLGGNAEVGLVRGKGDVGNDGRLEVELVDGAVTPRAGDTVVTWGSQNGVPYVAGIPIGRVESVFVAPRQSTLHVVVEPYADLTALDVVGVVVPANTVGDRGLVTSADPTVADR